MNWLARNRLLAGYISIVLTCLVGLGLIPWRVAKGPFHDSIVRKLTVALGATSVTASGMRLTILPFPRLTVQRLQITQASGTIRVSAAEAVVYLRPLTLLKASAKPTGIALFGADIHAQLHLNDDGGLKRLFSVVGQITDALATTEKSTSIARIDADQSTIFFERPDESLVEKLENVRLRLRNAGPEKPMSLVLHGKRNGEETRITFSGSSPSAIASGKIRPISFAFWSPSGSMEFEGDGALTQNVSLKGAVSASSGAQILRDNNILGRSGALSLKANLDFSSRGANLSDLKITRGAEQYDGVAAIRHDGQRWHYSGTLATEKADLTGFLSPFVRWRKADGSWNDKTIDVEEIFSTNVDLRLSAERFTAFEQTFENAAIAFIVRPNKAEFSLGDSRYQRGTARFRVTAQPGSFGVDLKMAATLEKIDLGAAIADIMGVRRLAGTGNVALNIETSGQTAAQFVSNAEGKFSANLRAGELVGIDLARLAARRDMLPELAFSGAIGGKTPVENATISARIANGAASSVDGYMQSGRLVGLLQGTIDFAQGQHNLTGSVVQSQSDQQKVEPIPILDISVTGPLSEPKVKPVLASQSKRS